MRVAVAGAGGYVGSALVARLAAAGHEVLALGRHARTLPTGADVSARVVDVADEGAVTAALAGIDAAYYLVHPDDAAVRSNFGQAAANARVGRIVTIGSLGGSPRAAVELAAGDVPVVELRAAPVLGAGSVAFEVLRNLAERVPVMLAPRWMRTPVQPIAERDLLEYLVQALQVPAGTYAVKGGEVTTYRDLIAAYAHARQLPRRGTISVPARWTGLSAWWIAVVSPVDTAAARRLLQSLRTDDGAPDPPLGLFVVEPVDVAAAIDLALDQQSRVVARSLATRRAGFDDGVYADVVELPIPSSLVDALDAGFDETDGDRWAVVERRRGALVVQATKGPPGDAWLGFFVRDDPSADQRDAAIVREVGAFRPRGFAGFVNWKLLGPLHRWRFRREGRRRVAAARRAAAREGARP